MTSRSEQIKAAAAEQALAARPPGESVSAPAPAGRLPLPPTVELRERQQTLGESLRDAWRHRHLVFAMGSTVMSLQFKHTILGWWWIPITVGMDTVGRALIFGGLLRLPSEPGIPYFLFLLVGMMAWRFFQRSLIFTLRSFQRFSRLTREFTFPLLLVPVAGILQGTLEFAMYVVFLAGALAYFSFADGTVYLELGPQLVLAPIGLLWAFLLAIGIGFYTAPIFARARDIRFVLRLTLPFWLYVTPIIYPLSALGGTARTIAQFNPMAPIVEVVKLGMFGTGVVTPFSVAWSFALTILTFVGGITFLNRFGPGLIGTSRYDEEDEEELA